MIHRDVKASNVLLDDEFNGRLGDFGLAKMYDRGADPRTTHVVGTLGFVLQFPFTLFFLNLVVLASSHFSNQTNINSPSV